ncbi:MAG: 2-C-methyl-D-erythritol 2,4-cyclodiphosphate synthase [Actinomycetaceae bacterium]|nr:2-C-methyl-D-erythritol 2,4-cyclodiphosphate synthase [Arcanobacterium sp.]MDD7505609.1 2-C-methyl-D-erythritol 2,4-cyclodiphosphate synthase [Actinomycetaceae bacterium]
MDVFEGLRVATAVDVHRFERRPDFEQSRDNSEAPELLQLSESRTGLGVSAAQQRSLRLACLEWPGEVALEGHSDGDAAAHALCDALLIASSVGEMGSIFGTDRPEFAGASGEEFLRETLRLVHEAGFGVVNASVQIIAQRPRFAPRKTEAEQRLSEIIAAPVSVSATTTDHLGFIGAGEGIAALATALLARRAHAA